MSVSTQRRAPHASPMAAAVAPLVSEWNLNSDADFVDRTDPAQILLSLTQWRHQSHQQINRDSGRRLGCGDIPPKYIMLRQLSQNSPLRWHFRHEPEEIISSDRIMAISCFLIMLVGIASNQLFLFWKGFQDLVSQISHLHYQFSKDIFFFIFLDKLFTHNCKIFIQF